MSPDVSEADFQRAVIDLAKLRQWKCWHDNYSRRNAAGWPDWFFLRNGRLLVVELKAEKGRLRIEQRHWMWEFTQVSQESRGAVYSAVWRPSDWPEIEQVLA